jgi:uncharacterized protein
MNADTQLITVNSLRPDGTVRRSWTCRPVSSSDELIVVEGVFAETVEHPDLGIIRPGTVSCEFYWTRRWYNVFRFSEPEGGLRNYYCNIAMPPRVSAGTLEYIDLDIDLVVWPDRSMDVLDLDDFRRNSEKFRYTKEMIEKAEASLAELRKAVEAGADPFTF